MLDAFDLRPEAIGILWLPTHRDGEQRAPVEAVHCRDDLVFLGAKDVMGITTRQFERRLVGLGARVAEERALSKGRIHQLFRQAQRRLVGEDIGDVPQLTGLLGERLHQCRMGMAQDVHSDTASQVNQLSPALIPYSRTLAAHRNKGSWSESGNDDLVEIGTFYRGVRGGHEALLQYARMGKETPHRQAGRSRRSLNAGGLGMSARRKILFCPTAVISTEMLLVQRNGFVQRIEQALAR